MGGFNNPVVGALKLIRRAIQSPNYVTGSSGWTINDDGSAEFNALTVRGNIVVQSNTQGIFLYSGTPAAGNLVASIASATGIDPYGNNFKAGFVSYRSATSFVQIWNGLLLFHDNSYAFDGTVNNHVASTPSDTPALQLLSPTGNPPSGTFPWAEIDLNGASNDGTNGPSILLSGHVNGGAEASIPVRVNGQVYATDPVNGGPETWHALPLTNSWTNAGGNHPSAQYRLLPSNEVQIIGRVSHAAVSGTSQLSTALPAAYRPPHLQDFIVPVFGNSAAPTASPVLSIDTSGVLTFFDLPTGTTSASIYAIYSLDA